MSCAKCRDGLRQMASGTHSRREVLLGAAALGLSSGAVGAVPVRAQDASTMPPYIPRPDSEILLPIAEPLTEEKVSFSLLSVHNPEVTDYDNNRFTEWLEEQTNVHVEWQLVSEEEAATELNLILASGDIPEIIFGIVTPSQEAHYGAQGLFLPLNDLIEEHAPRLKRIFEIYPAAKAALTAPDGNIYSMLFLEDCYHCTMSQKLWIYQPWLDALGLELPTTTDEFEQVLLAFKEQDPNGNGQADEIPLSTTMSGEGWQNRIDLFFMNSFSFNPGQDNPGGPWLILRDGRVTPVYNTPEWKEGLKYLQRLYSQGLIDPQSFTQDIDGLQRLGNNPDEVILGSVPAGYMGVFIALQETPDARFTDYVAVPPLEGPQGVRYAGWIPTTGSPATVITNACKDPALAVRWIDSLYGQEATLRQYRGVLGEDWRWAEEGELDLEGRQAIWKLLVVHADPTNTSWQGTAPMYVSEYLFSAIAVDPNTASLNVEAILHHETKTKYEPYKQPAEMVLPPLTFTEEQATAIADPEATIAQYVNQMFAQFVRREADIDTEWEQYLATLDGMGLAAYLQVYQEAYDVKYGG
jgi:putative aldouronate transport system substrate-binding protein